MLLDVQHISKSFTTGYIRKVKKDVLKDISFTLSKGETLGIAGTSGAGKTTLIRILMQLLVPDGGVVLYHGAELGELSGGELQRVALARLLLLSPKVLILDEPTSMLDVSVQAEILTLLQELQEDRKIAYLFISHDLDVLAAMASRVGILSAGRLVEIGTAEDVLHHPQHPYTQELVSSFSAL